MIKDPNLRCRTCGQPTELHSLTEKPGCPIKESAPMNATGPGVAGTTGEPVGGNNILMRLRRKKKLEEGWIRKGDEFHTTVKQAKEHDDSGKDIRCPQCRKKVTLSMSKWKAKIGKFTSTHDCGANLVANLKEDTFAGHPVFEVDSDSFHKARLGKIKPHRYSRYVGTEPHGEAIRAYGRANPNKPVILKHKGTGALLFLRYGKSPNRF